MMTARALRRDIATSAEQFPQDVQELQSYFAPTAPGQRIRAVPGAGLDMPIWLLGSSLFSAQLAAMLGLPFAFASHFAPDDMMQALQIYRSRFAPSQPERPYAMLGVNVWPRIRTRKPGASLRRSSSPSSISGVERRKVPPPIDDIDAYWSPAEKLVEHALACSIVGSADTVRRGLAAFINSTGRTS
jgi:luciferase family oxidoreductase group 1